MFNLQEFFKTKFKAEFGQIRKEQLDNNCNGHSNKRVLTDPFIRVHRFPPKRGNLLLSAPLRDNYFSFSRPANTSSISCSLASVNERELAPV